MVQRQIFRNHKGNWENAWACSRMTLMASRKFLVPKGTSRKDIWKLAKPQQSRGHLEHCFPVMATNFKLSEATSVCAFVALHSIQRLVISFAVFQIGTTNVYVLVSIYYVFLERVGMKLIDDYPVNTWFSTRHLDRREILDTVRPRYWMLNHDWSRVWHDWVAFSSSH